MVGSEEEGRQNYRKVRLASFFQGLLFGGYGAHFFNDRERLGTKMRSQAFATVCHRIPTCVLEYSGFAMGRMLQEPMLKAPWGFREVVKRNLVAFGVD